MKSSGSSPNSKSTFLGETALVAALLAILVACCAWWTFRQGFILYYGDAQAHLNNSRSLLDSRTPGYEQLGTVWLPMLHLLCLPFVRSMTLWSTGLAGTIPVSACFVIAGSFLYAAAREAYHSALAAAVVVACFALNPNVLYLSVIPMTEIVFLAGLAVLLYCEIRYTSSQKGILILMAAAASWWMSLTRYDGWFLIPLAALWFGYSARKHRVGVFLLFAAMASLAPLYWLGHSWWETGNAFDFFNGPYSAQAIQGGKPYPGFHDWRNAFTYYAAAGELCAGFGLLLAAVFGLAVCRDDRVLAPNAFLLLPCFFYVLSIHSSGNPIHVPQLFPFSYYNTRYGIALVVFASFAAGAIVPALRQGRRKFAMAIPLLAIAPWLLQPGREHWICWKESQVNSVARRSWTESTATFLRKNYREGQGIVAPFGDVSGVFCRAQIPLLQVLHEGNGPAWLATVKRPDLVHQQLWAVAQSGDALDRSLVQMAGDSYLLFENIQVRDAPAIHIYKRTQ